MTLAEIKVGQDAILRTIGGQGELRHHLLDMGLTPGTEVTLRKVAPMGDPIEVELRGYELTLRLADAAKIEVDNVHETDRAARSETRHAPVPHPGVGELRKAASYHDRKAGSEIAKGQPLRFALAGNQNCGKTTLFNQLTGSNQHVGNFPGVTVDRKDGMIRGHAEATVTDLPGIYSLSPYSSEEIVTRDFLLNTHPDGIINIVDATNIERNLYLTMQLMELEIPMVLALKMMDEVRANGGTIMVNELEELLGVPVVPISAAKNEGIDELVEHALHVARHREVPGRIDFCDATDGKDGAVHRCIHAVAHLIEDHAQHAGLPLRFSATKLVEGDQLIEAALQLDENETELLGHTIAELENETGLDRVAFVMDQLLRRVGLSGRSFVPMLIGFGCSVPAIMATRTLSSDRDRKMTILLTPFMSCSAKLPIYALFTTAFFPRQWRAVVMVGLYLTGIVCGILYALVLKLTRYKGEPVPFVMELPNYRFPSARSVGQLIWEKAKDFLQKAFTIIFVATVLIWFLQTFDTRLNVAAPDTSLLALIGSWVAPIFKPLGFGDWRVSTALITGFTAKESVVSTLTVLLGGDTAALSTMFTPFTAVVFLVFTLLYTPCVAAVAAAKRELGSAKAAAGVVVMQCGIAWVVAFVVHCIGTLLGFV